MIKILKEPCKSWKPNAGKANKSQQHSAHPQFIFCGLFSVSSLAFNLRADVTKPPSRSGHRRWKVALCSRLSLYTHSLRFFPEIGSGIQRCCGCTVTKAAITAFSPHCKTAKLVVSFDTSSNASCTFATIKCNTFAISNAKALYMWWCMYLVCTYLWCCLFEITDNWMEDNPILGVGYIHKTYVLQFCADWLLNWFQEYHQLSPKASSSSVWVFGLGLVLRERKNSETRFSAPVLGMGIRSCWCYTLY